MQDVMLGVGVSSVSFTSFERGHVSHSLLEFFHFVSYSIGLITEFNRTCMSKLWHFCELSCQKVFGPTAANFFFQHFKVSFSFLWIFCFDQVLFTECLVFCSVDEWLLSHVIFSSYVLDILLNDISPML